MTGATTICGNPHFSISHPAFPKAFLPPTFHKDRLVRWFLLRQLRKQRSRVQTQRGFTQQLVDLATPWASVEVGIWKFPNMGVPLNHPFQIGIFHYKPFLGTTIYRNYPKLAYVDDTEISRAFNIFNEVSICFCGIRWNLVGFALHELLMRFHWDFTGIQWVSMRCGWFLMEFNIPKKGPRFNRNGDTMVI